LDPVDLRNPSLIRFGLRRPRADKAEREGNKNGYCWQPRTGMRGFALTGKTGPPLPPPPRQFIGSYAFDMGASLV